LAKQIRCQPYKDRAQAEQGSNIHLLGSWTIRIKRNDKGSYSVRLQSGTRITSSRYNPHSPSYGCPTEQENVMPMGVVIIAIVAVSAGTLSTVLKIWLNRPGRSAIPQPEVKQIRDGLQDLQNAVDAIAIEVERLSEGQRFTTKLLADQAKKNAELIRSE
jgi:hypothetical protein